MKHSLLLCCSLLLAAFALPAHAYDFAVANGEGVKIYYNQTSPTTVEVTKNPDKYSGGLDIPSKITHNGASYTVSSIGEFAFANCNELTSIVIPNSVTNIGANAFWVCQSLNTVKIPDSVVTIGSSAFGGCKNLRAFYGKYASSDNKCLIINGVLNSFAPYWLPSYTIPSSVTAIGKDAFSGSALLASVTIPHSVTSIGESAFWGCLSLTSVVIPSSVTTIGTWAFYDCEHLQSVTIPSSVTHIGDEAFELCTQLDKVYIPEGTPANAASRKYFDPSLIAYLPADQIDAGQKISEAPELIADNAQHNSDPTAKQQAKGPTPLSDVDCDIPATGKNREMTFAVLFGNEDYVNEIKVPFAVNDANVMAQYFTSTLGIPQKNVRIANNATRNAMIMQIEWLKKVAKAFPEAEIIVYYSGHGMPDEASGQAMLIPVDGYSSTPATCYELSTFYKELVALNAKNVTVILDACFSGADRNDGMLLAARGVRLKAKAGMANEGKMVVMSASQGNETAFPYQEKSHGMFTYYLLKKLKESKGDVTLGELSDYVTTKVSQQSILDNNKSQTPSTAVTPALTNTWRSLPLASE